MHGSPVVTTGSRAARIQVFRWPPGSSAVGLGFRAPDHADEADHPLRLGDQALEDPLRAVELLDPDRGVGRHPDDLDEPALDAHNERILQALQRDGRVYLSNATVDGRFALRACITNFRTTRADVEAAIRRHGGPLLRSIRLFDIYRGRPLTDDEKSLAYRLAFQADHRTLVETEVDDAVAGVTSGLVADVGGRLRT